MIIYRNTVTYNSVRRFENNIYVGIATHDLLLIQETYKLIKDMNISNIMLVPKIEKIVLNMGLGDAKLNKNGLKQAQDELSTITGQKLIKFTEKIAKFVGVMVRR